MCSTYTMTILYINVSICADDNHIVVFFEISFIEYFYMVICLNQTV